MFRVPILAISGPHGAGKSTVAKLVAEKLGYRYVSAGDMFRKIAKERGKTLEEFSKLAEMNEEIDHAIDQETLKIAEQSDNLVVDAQLAGWLLKDKADLLIYITAPIEIRIERIAKRDGKSIEQSQKETLVREKSEKNRYQKLYKINISDTSIYDIIINSKKFNANDCVEIILKAVNLRLKEGDKK